MARLKPIKSLKSGNYNVLDSLNNYIFGPLNLTRYSTAKTYYKGNTVLMYNSTTGRYDIMRCTATSTTGTYKPADWTVDNVQKTVQDSSFFRTTIYIDTANRNIETNQMWFQAVQVKPSIDLSLFSGFTGIPPQGS